MTRILIADDHAVVRQGLIEILTHALKDVVCSEAADAQEAFSQVQRHDWHLIILDISLPGRSGIDLLPDLKRVRSKTPVLILSAHPEAMYGKRVLQANASGYLNKTCACEELIQAVRKVIAGGRYISEALAEKLALDSLEEQDKPLHENLSHRELEVLCMIASGKTLSQIAAVLHVALTTVSSYRARILEKMKMTSTAELMHYALWNELVQ
jgi:DNA-binding NarL/FixJ family response regulator